MYRPRVSAALAGQKIIIENHDPTLHNVHAFSGNETAFNRSQPKTAKPIEYTLEGKPGDVLTLRCDVHPWMRAFVFTVDSPHHAVTGKTGGFSFAKLPAGFYTVTGFHPTLGKKQTTVTVAKKPLHIELSFP